MAGPQAFHTQWEGRPSQPWSWYWVLGRVEVGPAAHHEHLSLLFGARASVLLGDKQVSLKFIRDLDLMFAPAGGQFEF